MKCPECGKEYGISVLSRSKTHLPIKEWIDDDKFTHRHDPNTYTATWVCVDECGHNGILTRSIFVGVRNNEI